MNSKVPLIIAASKDAILLKTATSLMAHAKKK